MIQVRLDRLMKEKGYTGSLRSLAIDINDDRERIRRFAANEMTKVPLDLIDKLCDFFDCEINELLIRVKDN